MDKCCRNHLIAYILGILIGVLGLYLMYHILDDILDRNNKDISEISKKLDNINDKTDKIYAILDINSTCEDIIK